MNRFTITSAMLGLITACFAPSMRASDWNKETRLTINHPLQVQNTLLAPGQYVFKLVDPNGSQSLVGVYNADGTRLEGMIMGWSAYRTDAGDKKLVTVSQSQGEQPATLKTWFYPGDNYGVEFPVSKLPSASGRVAKSKGKGQTTGATGGVSSTTD
jgi:hypothetical protein